MSFIKLHKENFYENLFEQKNISSLLEIVSNKYSNEKKKSTHLNVNHQISNTDNIYSFKLVPDYLNIKTNEGFIEKKVFQKNGYGINLTNCKSADEYLQNYCKTNFRGNIRRSIKKIESCFNINYKMFYGNISLEDYTFLMGRFHDMLSKRFKQRNDKNLILENWEFYQTNAFNLINKNDASLFVIYNEKEPIACSLNFHHENIFYFAIPTFHIDYYKFAPGNIVVYKNIDWCIMNNYSFFDMGYGGFENKLNWCNTTYNFENLVLFKPGNILGNLYAFHLKNKYKDFNYLIDHNINTKVRKIKNILKNSKPYQSVNYEVLSTDSNDNFKNASHVKLIENQAESHKDLNRPICDFLYKHNEHLNNISVYKFDNEPKNYVISGKANQQKIRILN